MSSTRQRQRANIDFNKKKKNEERKKRKQFTVFALPGSSAHIYIYICCFVNLGRGQFMHIRCSAESIPRARYNHTNKIKQRKSNEKQTELPEKQYVRCVQNDLFDCLREYCGIKGSQAIRMHIGTQCVCLNMRNLQCTRRICSIYNSLLCGEVEDLEELFQAFFMNFTFTTYEYSFHISFGFSLILKGKNKHFGQKRHTQHSTSQKIEHLFNVIFQCKWVIITFDWISLRLPWK